MDSIDELLAAWTTAAADLGLATKPERRGEVVWLGDFGRARGMLLTVRSGSLDELKAAYSADGIGFSVLSGSYLTYERRLFIDTLNDWGWSGEGPAPDWYTDQPWTE